MREIFLEIFCSMRQNKLRTGLTGFSVAWGIFMLIILLGSGNGLKNGVTSNHGNMGMNTITIYPGYTMLPYKGYDKYRRIEFKYEDIAYIANNIPEIKYISARRYISAKGTNPSNNTFADVGISGATPMYDIIKGGEILSGRFINKRDIEQVRKVVVLGEYAVNVFFGDEDPIDKTILIDNITYSVVGVIKIQWDNSCNVFIPLTTAISLYTATDNQEINDIRCEIEGVNSVQDAKNIEIKFRKEIAKKHSFSPDDQDAVWIYNSIENYMQTQMIFSGISIFIWIIGLATLMAGIVGVSNIMLVTVRERTNEFGIRKSLGATPRSIVQLILIEAISITLIFGYIGMVLGTGVMEVVNIVTESIASKGDSNNVVFLNPTIDLDIAINATILLVVAGAIAGYIPARKAARLKTIDAMRHNK